MGRIVALLTCGLPFIILPWVEDPWNEPKELAWLVGCWSLILVWMFHAQPIWNTWKNRWVAWLGGWVLLMGVWHFYWPFLTRPPGATHIDYAVHHWIPTVYALTAFLTVRVLSAWFSNPTTVAWVSRWFCVTAIVVAAYAIGQGFHIEEFFKANYLFASPNHPMGVAFGNAGTTTMWLAVLLPLFFIFHGWRWVILGFFVAIPIVWVPCRSAWIVAAVGIGTYGFLRLWHRTSFRKWRFVLASLLGFVLVSGVMVGTRLLQHDERALIWSETIYQWQTSKHPWTGQGLQAFPDKFINQNHTLRSPAQNGSRWTTPFNEWLGGLYELGLIGIGLAGLVVWSLFRRAWDRTGTPVGAGWFACGMAMITSTFIFFPFHYAPTMWQAMVMWSVLEQG